MVSKVPKRGIVPHLAVLFLCLGLSALARGAENGPRGLLSPSPWFTTGTLLSTRGRAIDHGRLNIFSLVYNAREGGLYNNYWQFESATIPRNVNHQTYIAYGLTSRMDIQLALQWEYFRTVSKPR